MALPTTKTDYRAEYRSQLSALGNLTTDEIDELVGYEFLKPASSVDEQVRRYYLKLKSERPQQAAGLLAETQPLLDDIADSGNMGGLCDVLGKYISGFIIRHKGRDYTPTPRRKKNNSTR